MQGEFRADVTRDTFDPGNRYSRVLLQQGRVLLDADWNEQTSILLDSLRILTVDLLGPYAGFDAAFRIDENNPTGRAGAASPFDFWFGPGHYYVGGLLCSNDRWRRFSAQPKPPASSTANPDAVRLEAGSYLVFLDVWERHVTWLDDDRIRDVALGGPDTATRAQVVWQVRAVEWAPSSAANTAEARRREAETYIADNRTTVSAVTMRCRAGHVTPPGPPGSTSPGSRYTGAENRLYRVEVHRGGVAWNGTKDGDGNPAGNAGNAATFKWSRDNASVALPIRSLSNVTVRLESLGPDDRHTIHPEDWVEIVDDRLIGRAGELWQVDVVNTDDRTATLRRRNGREPLQLAGDDRHHHPLLRRWDHSGDAKVTLEGGIPLTEASGEDDGSWIRLEEGIQIQFGGGRSYRAGDYWLVPARTATGDVLWPVERDDNGAVVHRQGNAIAAPLPPHGVEHHYAPIGLVRFRRDGAFESHDDLRRIVERLAR